MTARRDRRFPAHVPTGVGDSCSIMCDHPHIRRDPTHQAVVDGWRRDRERPATPDRPTE